jgi:hypothetical protein
LAALALLSVLLAPCGDSTGSGGGRGGWLALQMTTPNTDDGGVLITVSGPAIDSVRSTHPQLITRRESAASVRVIIGGNLTAGVIGEIRVPDMRQAGQYSAVLHEVAARNTYQQRALTGYGLSLVARER